MVYTSYAPPEATAVATRSVVGGGGGESGWTMTLGGEEGAKLFAEHEAQRRRRTCFPQRDKANGAPCFAQRGQTMSFWSSTASLLFGRAIRVTEPTLGSSCDVSTRPLCRAVSASSCNASLLGFTKEHDLRFESCRKRSTARELPDRSFFAFANDRHASFEAKLASHIGEAGTTPRVLSNSEAMREFRPTRHRASPSKQGPKLKLLALSHIDLRPLYRSIQSVGARCRALRLLPTAGAAGAGGRKWLLTRAYQSYLTREDFAKRSRGS